MLKKVVAVDRMPSTTRQFQNTQRGTKRKTQVLSPGSATFLTAREPENKKACQRLLFAFEAAVRAGNDEKAKKAEVRLNKIAAKENCEKNKEN